METLLKRMFLVFFILGQSLNLGSSDNISQAIEKDYILSIEQQYIEIYEEAIQSLKSFEGLRLKTYYCLAGQKTIGYGHAIQPEEYFSTITIEQADSLLRQDFNNCIKAVLNTTRLHKFDDANKVIALSLFVYNCGIGNFNKSTLRDLVNTEQAIDKEIVKWTYVKTQKGYVHSTHLLMRRKYERDIYNT